MTSAVRTNDAKRATARAELIAEHLPGIVDEALDNDEIAAGIDRAGLDRDVLHEGVLANERIIAPANGLLEDLVTVRLTGIYPPLVDYLGKQLPKRWVHWVSRLLVPGYVVAIGTFLLLANPPWWVLAAVIAGGLGVGVLSGTIAGRFEVYDKFRSQPETGSPVVKVAVAGWKIMCRDSVVAFLRRVINEHLEPLRRTSLSITPADTPGLTGRQESAFVVATGSVRRFVDTTERLRTGAIGIAGPRGVGKTTLIDNFAVPAYTGPAPLYVTVSAPVHYEPREFVLHLFACVCRAVLREHPVPRRRRFTRRRKRVEIGEVASEQLDDIQYLQTHTTGWSGKLALPMSTEAGWSRSVQRERRPQTYPELVQALRGFLGECAALRAADPAVIIAIDELDKIETADLAQRFINEIKSVFGVPGTLFLVSVSEDALASFERRGLPVRDAFDSAFHEIVLVDYLLLRDTTELLNSRVIGFPEPFVRLGHCFSGGLPRDVVRTARAMVAVATPDDPPSLDDVCATLVGDDLARKGHAFQIACRGIGDAPEVTEFIRQLRSLQADATALLATLPAMVSLPGDGELAMLRRQAAAYLYHCATLLETFTRARDNELRSGERDAGDSFDTLARAKQSLAVHPRLAWLLIDEFRAAWGFEVVPAD